MLGRGYAGFNLLDGSKAILRLIKSVHLAFKICFTKNVHLACCEINLIIAILISMKNALRSA
jgi:hypothetical protein